MIAASTTPPPAPQPGAQPIPPRKPDGGYRLITVTQIAAAWTAYKQRDIRLEDLRAYFACHELVARRCRKDDDPAPGHFNHDELARLVGTSPKRARAAVARLQRAGLLQWHEQRITFASTTDALPPPTRRAADAMLDKIPNHRRRVPVPRRILRLIAGGARPVLIATILAHLLRCLYIRDGRCHDRGRCKASWVADVFAVDLRRVKAARRDLIDLGWLRPEPSPQWALNRWGQAVRINLHWDRADRPAGPELPPPPAGSGPELPPPDPSDRQPLRGVKNQEPAPGGSPGISIPNGAGKKPSLRHIVSADLTDIGRTLELYDQAVRSDLVGPSEHDRLRFVAAAEHARAIGTRNPCGLFARILRSGLWRVLTQDDEDAAGRRLRRHLFGPPRSPAPPEIRPPVPSFSPPAAASEDARLVAAIRSAASRSGYRGDAFYLLKRERPEWTRDRWDRAMAESDRGGAARAGVGSFSVTEGLALPMG